MHIYWFVTDQPNIYSSLMDTSVGVWPCMGIGIINMVMKSNYSSQCNITHYIGIVCQLEKSTQHAPPCSLVISPRMEKLHYFKSFIGCPFFKPITLSHCLNW